MGAIYDVRITDTFEYDPACHVPDDLGLLSWPMDETIIDSYINGGQMPRGEALRRWQRNELYKRLIQEYFSRPIPSTRES